MGYRNASIFNQEAEILGYKNVNPINRNTTFSEQSYGGNADIGYRFSISDKVWININQMFFYTYLKSPMVLQNNGTNYEFVNANGYTKSIGGETFFKLGFYDFVFFAGAGDVFHLWNPRKLIANPDVPEGTRKRCAFAMKEKGASL